MNHVWARKVSNFAYVDIHPTLRFKNKLLPVMLRTQLSTGGFSGECHLLVLSCVRINNKIKTSKKRCILKAKQKAKAKVFCLSSRGFRTNTKNSTTLTQKSKTATILLLLPALSPVLQLMGASHSNASIVECAVIALTRPYFDWLTNWLMVGWLVDGKLFFVATKAAACLFSLRVKLQLRSDGEVAYQQTELFPLLLCSIFTRINNFFSCVNTQNLL